MRMNSVRVVFTDDEKEEIVPGLTTAVTIQSGDKGELRVRLYPRNRMVATWLPEIKKWQYMNHHYRTMEVWSPQED